MLILFKILSALCEFVPSILFFHYKTLFLSLKECKFHVGSYIHDATQIQFTGTFGHDTVNQRAQQYEINITKLDDVDQTVVWANRNYSQTGFKVRICVLF